MIKNVKTATLVASLSILILSCSAPDNTSIPQISTADSLHQVSANSKDVVKAFYESFNNHDLDKSFEQYVSPTMINHALGGSVTWQQWRDMDKGFIASCPDLKLTLKEIVAEGDKVSSYFVITGTHTAADFMDIRATGNKVQNEVMAIDRVENGKIAEHSTIFDMGAFLNGFKPAGR